MYSSIPSRSDNNAAKAGPRPGFFDAAGIQAPARRPDTGRLKKRCLAFPHTAAWHTCPLPMTASSPRCAFLRRPAGRTQQNRPRGARYLGRQAFRCALQPCARRTQQKRCLVPPRYAAWRGGPGRNSAGRPLPREKAASLCKIYAMGPAQAGHKKERVWARSFFIQWGKAKRHSRHVGDSLSGIFDEGMVCFKQALSPETGNFRWRRHPALRCR